MSSESELPVLQVLSQRAHRSAAPQATSAARARAASDQSLPEQHEGTLRWDTVAQGYRLPAYPRGLAASHNIYLYGIPKAYGTGIVSLGTVPLSISTVLLRR